MTATELSRRRYLLGAASLGSVPLLASCVGSGGGEAGGGQASATVTLQGGYSSSWNVIAAGSLVAAVPTAIVFFVFQKQFVSGLLVGSNK